MDISELSDRVGKVVLLDLVSGMQVCTEIKSIDEESGKITTGKIMIFQVVVEPQDPSRPPDQNNPVVQKVNTLPYGGPFIHPKSENVLYAANIIMPHEPVNAIEKGYLQAVSGIEIAGAGSIRGISGE